jgi:hypothetical protein
MRQVELGAKEIRGARDLVATAWEAGKESAIDESVWWKRAEIEYDRTIKGSIWIIPP